jgi:hypothetical protein
MDQILESLRKMLMDHMAAVEPLTADIPIGTTIVTLPNTCRFRDNDEIVVMAPSGNVAELNNILHVGPPAPSPNAPYPPDDGFTLVLGLPVVKTWTVAEGALVQKAINHMPVKRIHVGNLTVIPSFPTICIEPASEDNEWMTLRGTSHDYKINIRTYVLADNFEKTTKGLPKITEVIRELLMEHIHPIIAGEDYPLLLDAPFGTTVIKVSDTSKFRALDYVYIRDARAYTNYDSNQVRTVLDAQHLELKAPLNNGYLISRQAYLTRVLRYLYDTRPQSINYGFVTKGGSLLRASEISWFGKEFLCRPGNILTGGTYMT